MQFTTTQWRETCKPPLPVHASSSLSRWLLTATVLVGVLLSLGTAGISAQEANPNGLPYIIVFKDTVNPHAAAPEFAKAYGLQPGFIYEHALKGMSAVVPEGRLIALQHDPRVAYVVRRSGAQHQCPVDAHRHPGASLPIPTRRLRSTALTITGWMWTSR